MRTAQCRAVRRTKPPRAAVQRSKSARTAKKRQMKKRREQKAPTRTRARHFCKKRASFSPDGSRKKGREDEPIYAQRRWIEQCLKLDLKDAGLSIPTFVKDRALLGFSGMNVNGIVCRFEDFDGIFTPDWKYDRDKKAWRVKYVERLWRGMPRDALNARDNSAEFGNVLVQIRDFASKIGCENFAQTFDNALKILRGEVPVGEYYAVSFAALPQPSLRAFAAAGIADVFGAMGSWDDEPSSMAQEMGLGGEYDRLSDELLAQKNLAILFAINAW